MQDLYKSKSCSRIALVSRTRLLQYLSKRLEQVVLIKNGSRLEQEQLALWMQVSLLQYCARLEQESCASRLAADLSKIWARWIADEMKKKYTRLLQYLSKRPWVLYKTPWGMANLGQGCYLHKSCPNLAQVILHKLSCTRLAQVLYKTPWGMASLG